LLVHDERKSGDEESKFEASRKEDASTTHVVKAVVFVLAVGINVHARGDGRGSRSNLKGHILAT